MAVDISFIRENGRTMTPNNGNMYWIASSIKLITTYLGKLSIIVNFENQHLDLEFDHCEQSQIGSLYMFVQ